MDAKELTAEIVRGVIALVLIAGFLYLAIVGTPIPEGLAAIVAGVVGYFFGAGGAAVGARLARAR